MDSLSAGSCSTLYKRKTESFDEFRTSDIPVYALDLYSSFFSGFDDRTMLSNPMFHGVSEWIYDDDFVKLAEWGLELGRNNGTTTGTEMVTGLQPVNY